MNTKNTKWVLDPAHSELTFKVKHLMITNVKGEFRHFNASFISNGDDFDQAAVTATIDAASIDTNNADRNNHLKAADFFDVANYKDITFTGTELKKLDDENYLLKGLLQIKGISKEITLDVEFGGLIKDPYGNHKAGFTFSGKINRKDWGLNWNAVLEGGGVMVSEDVRINGDVQFIKQVEVPAAAETAMA